MTDKTTTAKTKTALGTLLTVAATAIATAVAMKYSNEIGVGFKTLAQKMADGSLGSPTPASLNGRNRHPAPASAG